MRVALIADIQGNAVALEAALADLLPRQPDAVVCLGDVATGPQPRAVIDRLRQIGCLPVMGNMDAALLTPSTVSPVDGTDTRWAEIDAWCAAQLMADDRAYLHSFQPAIHLDLGHGLDLLCCHGSPSSFNDAIDLDTPDDMIALMMQGKSPAALATGHMHRQFERQCGGMRIVSPGSIGWPPPDTRTNRRPLEARYSIVAAVAGALEITPYRVSYGSQEFTVRLKAVGIPHSNWWLRNWDVGSEERD